MTPQKFHLVDGKRKDNACAAIQQAPIGWVVTLAKPNRTTAQNALLHVWFSDIAKHFRDRTYLDVKIDCNLVYCLPIRMRNESFAWVWRQTGAKMNDIQVRKFISAPVSSGRPAMSSGCDKDELSEYMTAMWHDYSAEGVKLTDPEDRKWIEYEKQGTQAINV